jgi:hypothetical protein
MNEWIHKIITTITNNNNNHDSSNNKKRIDIAEAQKKAAAVPHCPLEVTATDEDNAKGAAYFTENKEHLRAELLKYGAIWFRGFDLMQDVQGYRIMHESLGLDPCLDPLHSSGLRKFASERDALYEEVRYYIYNIYICIGEKSFECVRGLGS